MSTLVISSTGAVVGSSPAPLIGVPATFVLGETSASVDAAQLVPLTPVPSQQISITLNSQPCTISIYTKHIQVPFVPSGGIPTDPPIYAPIDPVFMDLYVNDLLILGGVLCLDRTSLVLNSYVGFIGYLVFIDIQGTTDPVYTALGTRYQLCYFPHIAGT